MKIAPGSRTIRSRLIAFVGTYRTNEIRSVIWLAILDSVFLLTNLWSMKWGHCSTSCLQKCITIAFRTAGFICFIKLSCYKRYCLKIPVIIKCLVGQFWKLFTCVICFLINSILCIILWLIEKKTPSLPFVLDRTFAGWLPSHYSI